MEKNANKKYLATLMKSHIIGDDHILYLPVKSMQGNVEQLSYDINFYEIDNDLVDENNIEDYLNNENNIAEDSNIVDVFVDECGNNYWPISMEKFPFMIEEYAYANLTDLDELLANSFGKTNEEKLEHAITAFTSEFDNQIFDAILQEDGTYRLYRIDLNSLLSIEPQEDDLEDEYAEEINSAEDDELSRISNLSTEELLALLANNKLNESELKQIKDSLQSTKEDIETLEECVDTELEKKYTYNDRDKKEAMYNELFSDPAFFDDLTKFKEIYGVDTFDRNDVFKKVSSVVISQDEHIKRLLSELQRIDIAEASRDIDNNTAILLTGSTGVGKTEIMRQIAKAIDRPFMIVDTNQITSAGYVGTDIEEILYQLYIDCGKDIKKTEKAIIYFDEIDKMGSSRNDDVNGKAVLNALLKFIDGTTYRAKSGKKDSNFININTSKMRIIFGGAFTSVYKDFNKHNNKIGFGSVDESIKSAPDIDDFVAKAQMPDEFMGRCSPVIHLNELMPEDLEQILLKSNKSEIKNQQKLFKQIGFNLIYTPGYIKEIANQAYEEKTGARSLKRKVSASAWKALDFAVDHAGEFDTVKFTKQTAIYNDKYEVYNQDKTKDKVKQKRIKGGEHSGEQFA